jgi:hypothetical protein
VKYHWRSYFACINRADVIVANNSQRFISQMKQPQSVLVQSLLFSGSFAYCSQFTI